MTHVELYLRRHHECAVARSRFMKLVNQADEAVKELHTARAAASAWQDFNPLTHRLSPPTELDEASADYSDACVAAGKAWEKLSVVEREEVPAGKRWKEFFG